jgi:hypothetical protein
MGCALARLMDGKMSPRLPGLAEVFDRAQASPREISNCGRSRVVPYQKRKTTFPPDPQPGLIPRPFTSLVGLGGGHHAGGNL